MAQDIGVDGVLIGHATDRLRGTGCTVVLVPKGCTGSVEVRGQAPGTRETDILSPFSSITEIHGIALCGGVVRYLEEHGYGLETPYNRIPLVAAAVIFDLPVSDHKARPRPEDGYAAAASASRAVEEGSLGVGTGATVGKLFGEESWMKGGVGLARVSLPGDVTVAALTVVNAFGDVLDEEGRVLAGAWANGEFLNVHDHALRLSQHPHFGRMEQTTLSVVITNARFRKTQCHMIARMAHDGMARAVSPIHTPVDGDVVFVLSVGDAVSNVFQVGIAAGDAVADGIRRAVRLAESVGGVPALRDQERPIVY